MNKKEKMKVQLKTSVIMEEFNKNQTKILENQLEIFEKIEKLKQGQNDLIAWTTGLTNCVISRYDGFDNFQGEVTIPCFNKDYVVVPNYRTESLINKERAIKVIEIDKEGNQNTKYTTLKCLTKDEKEEYKKDGFIIEKIKIEEKENGK